MAMLDKLQVFFGEPTLQSVHTVDSSRPFVDFPASHFEHTGVPSASENFPASQILQLAALWGLYHPAIQFEHITSNFFATLPAIQPEMMIRNGHKDQRAGRGSVISLYHELQFFIEEIILRKQR